MSVGKDKASAASAARETSRVTGTGDTASVQLSDDAVREFLKDNGDFLQRNPDLLDHLHVSHASGSAVSLVEKQVSVLRERNVDIRHRLNDLTAHARDNDKLFEQTRALVIKLLEADSIAELYRAFSESMRTGFELEFATMILFGDNTDEKNYRVETAELAQANIGALLSGQKAVCGALRREEFSYLFAKDGNTHKFHQGGSAAVVPLNDGAQLGLIAIGSSDANRFSSDMGTLFLSHIADVVLRLLPRMTGTGS
tara:strand:+ start:159017 stop:159781 length:765 start_codon:yes stop_codon:yes gene_type:complete